MGLTSSLQAFLTILELKVMPHIHIESMKDYCSFSIIIKSEKNDWERKAQDLIKIAQSFESGGSGLEF